MSPNAQTSFLEAMAGPAFLLKMHIAFVSHVQSETGMVLSKTRCNVPDDEGVTVREVRPS